MSQDVAKAIYEDLLKEGTLKEMFPDMTGDWPTDSKLFIKQYEHNQVFTDGGEPFDEFYEEF